LFIVIFTLGVYFFAPPPLLSLLDYSLLFVTQFLSFVVVGRGISVPRGYADLCFWEWKREFCMVCCSHLFFFLPIDVQAGLAQAAVAAAAAMVAVTYS
jgi:hypothetical protein